MPELELLCDRPHFDRIDYETSRFIVAQDGTPVNKALGLTMGDEIPRGALDARTLRLEYKCFRIEVDSYAATKPYLREACARRGVRLDQPAPSSPASQPVVSDARARVIAMLDPLTRRELTKMCEDHGLSSDGSKQDLRERLAALLDR